jgi:hypothetical protein
LKSIKKDTDKNSESVSVKEGGYEEELEGGDSLSQ